MSERGPPWSWSSVPGHGRGQRAPPSPAGAHYLLARYADLLVAQADLRPGDLVFDLGAGGGAVTAPLVRAGVRVVAVERDERSLRRLRRRFGGVDTVRVVAGDAREIPLPRREFRVVANIPFGVTTALVARLLDCRSLSAADLVVASGVGRALTAPRPGNVATLGWSVRFELSRGAALPAGCFVPPPSVDAVVLRVRRRARPLVAGPAQRRAFDRLVRTGYRRPDAPWADAAATVLPRRQVAAVARERGLDPRAPVTALRCADWAVLATRAVPPRGGRAHGGGRGTG